MKQKTAVALAVLLVALTASAGLQVSAGDHDRNLSEIQQLGQEGGDGSARWDVDLGVQDSIDDVTVSGYLIMLLMSHVSQIGYAG